MGQATVTLLNLLALLQAGIDVSAAASQMYAKMQAIQAEGRDPTPEEWDELNARIEDLRKELHAPD